VVFGAFTDPVQLARWWGPNGFTNTIGEFDLRPGGRWTVVMHGPDGADYGNEWETVEVVKPERLVFVHLRPMHRFRLAITLEDLSGQTRLTWLMQLDPHPQNEAMKTFIAAANEQNLDRLAAHLRTPSS
jgi:uncharacterized protein YndB with AHSA1/START domain